VHALRPAMRSSCRVNRQSPLGIYSLPGVGLVFLDAQPSSRNPDGMTDAEDCAKQLRGLATMPDTPEAREKIDTWLDV
jgi:hypothetical protein